MNKTIIRSVLCVVLLTAAAVLIAGATWTAKAQEVTSAGPFRVGACIQANGTEFIKILEASGAWIKTSAGSVPFGPTWVNTAVFRSVVEIDPTKYCGGGRGK